MRPVKVRIEINMDNAAFGDDNARSMPELARILGALAVAVMCWGAETHAPRDMNGNIVGKITFSGMGRKKGG